MTDPATLSDDSATAGDRRGTGEVTATHAWPGPGAADANRSVSEPHGEAARVLATCLLRLAEAHDDSSGLRWWAARLCLAAGPGGAPADGPVEAGTGPCRLEGALTSREFEVAALISQGMTNRRIAAKLRISDCTANTHVRNILCKLGMDRRSQIASWVVRQQLYASLWGTVSKIADEVAGGPARPRRGGAGPKPPPTQFERLT